MRSTAEIKILTKSGGIVKNEKFQIKSALERLSRQRRQILSMPSEKALDFILDAQHPAAIIHSFSEQDFYFLIHDIGVEDCLPLLSLASHRQWEYALDIETWKKDRLEIQSMGKWFDLLFQADSERFLQWFLNRQISVVEFYLSKNIEVKIREHDQDSSEFGDEFFTLDDVFYVRINNDIHNDFLPKFIEHLANHSHITYQQTLLEAMSVIPAEIEEEAYRLRNVRLAEKGFLPFEEAIGVYQPLRLSDIAKQPIKLITRCDDENLPVPLYSTEMLQNDNLFATSLLEIKTDNVLRQIQAEFANLCNQIISADQKTIKSKKELRGIVKKGCGYISIGLEHLSSSYEVNDKKQCVRLIQKYPLLYIFRIGYGFALRLKWRAEKWIKKSWFSRQRLPLSFWDEKWFGALGGILLKNPLFYDNYKIGSLFREFVCLDDINETEKILNEVIAFDDLLFLMSLNFDLLSDTDGLLTYKNLLLTFWARHYLGLSGKLAPIDIDEFKKFFDDLFVDFADFSNVQRKIKTSMKESFIKMLAGQANLALHEISGRMGKTFEKLFNEIESEYGRVAKKDIDPKYINLFFVKASKEQ